MINTDETGIYEDYRLCPKCGKKVLAADAFCAYCGTAVEEQSEIKSITPYEPTPNTCGNVDNTQALMNKKVGKGYKIATIILSIVLAIAVAGVVYCYFIIEDKESIIAETQDDLAVSEKKVSSLKKQVAELEIKADIYDDICLFMSNSDAGYANGNFKSSDKIVFLKSGGNTKNVTITTGYNTTYSSNWVGSSASGNFKYNSWSGTSTTYIFTSKFNTGITMFTFSNNAISKTFRVMVVVY